MGRHHMRDDRDDHRAFCVCESFDLGRGRRVWRRPSLWSRFIVVYWEAAPATAKVRAPALFF